MKSFLLLVEDCFDALGEGWDVDDRVGVVEGIPLREIDVGRLMDIVESFGEVDVVVCGEDDDLDSRGGV